MNIRLFLSNMETNQIKNRIHELHKQMHELDSEHEVVSAPTTIESDMTSEVSIKCQSFHTIRSSCNHKHQNSPTEDIENASRKRQKMLRVKEKLENFCKNYRRDQIQIKNAKRLFRESLNPTKKRLLMKDRDHSTTLLDAFIG